MIWVLGLVTWDPWISPVISSQTPVASPTPTLIEIAIVAMNSFNNWYDPLPSLELSSYIYLAGSFLCSFFNLLEKLEIGLSIISIINFPSRPSRGHDSYISNGRALPFIHSSWSSHTIMAFKVTSMRSINGQNKPKTIKFPRINNGF